LRADTPRRDEIKGKKRHILVDTQGLLLHALVHSADIQDRNDGVLVMATLFGLYPFLLKLYATAAIRGRSFSPPFAKSSGKSTWRSSSAPIWQRALRSSQAMDRRTHHRVAQPMPPLGRGMGVPQPKGLGVLAPRLNPPHAQKALSKKIMIPDRLSDHHDFSNRRTIFRPLEM